MQFNIKTSSELVKKLTKKMQLGEENHIARISLAYSLANGADCLTDGDVSPYEKQKEYKDDTLFGKYKDYYVSLICQKYQIHKDDINVKKYLKWHIDKGLEMINLYFEQNPNLWGTEFLLDQIKNGIRGIDSVSTVVKPTITIKKDCFLEPIPVLIGEYQKKEVYFTPNDIKYSNSHIAVAGTTGSGKSFLARRILERIVQESKRKVNYLYLDFKGEKQNYNPEDDSLSDIDRFLKATNAKFINVPKQTFPINPLSFINSVNDQEKNMGIRLFVETVATYANLGALQRDQLKKATLKAFNDRSDGTYPTLLDVFKNVKKIVKNSSSLTEILGGLTDVKLFNDDETGDFINENYYFSLGATLSEEVRFTAVFLIIRWMYNIFMSMEDVPYSTQCRGLRYVLFIDEAHNLFKKKKTRDVLEKLLREVRSRGVSVMLVSQGIDDFCQPEFNFSDMCQFSFLMKIKNGINWKPIASFLGASESEKNELINSLNDMDVRQAISNIKEIDFGSVFNTK